LGFTAPADGAGGGCSSVIVTLTATAGGALTARTISAGVLRCSR
jgi:hypothetical protein